MNGGQIPIVIPTNSKVSYDRVNPHINYHKICDLLHATTPEKAYLPLSIGYDIAPRDARTGEITYNHQPESEKQVSYEQLAEAFRKQHAKWEASEGCRKLKTQLASAKIHPISKVTAFACGPMYVFGRVSINSILQHALILTLRDVFGIDTAKCMSQEPYYKQDDKTILNNEGITPLDDPLGFLEVDEKSAVISVGPDVPIRSIVMDLAKPALMIWNDHDVDREADRDAEELLGEISRGWADPLDPRLRDVLQKEYTKFKFPGTEYGYEDDELAVYIRK